MAVPHRKRHTSPVVTVTPSVHGRDNFATLYGMKAGGNALDSFDEIEFSAWCWMSLDELAEITVVFRRSIYRSWSEVFAGPQIGRNTCKRVAGLILLAPT
jgi:hypothetical protein